MDWMGMDHNGERQWESHREVQTAVKHFFGKWQKIDITCHRFILDTASQLIGACFLHFPVGLVVALAPSVYIHHDQVTGSTC